jgi:hypothetical protein
VHANTSNSCTKRELRSKIMNTGNEKTAGVKFGQAVLGTAAQRSTVVRMNLFVLVRILFQYLERVDPSTLTLAKEVSLITEFDALHNLPRVSRCILTDIMKYVPSLVIFF